MNAVRRLEVHAPAGLEGELAAVIGDAAAANLLRAFAGRTVYVPRAPGLHHPITAAIGARAAANLAEFYHGSRIEFPVAVAKRRRIVELKAAGWRTGTIAADQLCTERFVRKVLAQARADDHRQPRLFA